MADENIQDTSVQTGNDVATQDDAASAAGVKIIGKDTTAETKEIAPAFDPQKSYDSLSNELQNVTKSYKELQREFTRRNQDSSEVRKQLEGLHKLFQEATKEEVSPEDFMKSLQANGVKAFDPLREQWTKQVKEEYDAKIKEINDNRIQDRNSFELMKRELDVKTYPSWNELKPKMNEIANSENCPIDWNQDLGVIYDTLYKLAKDGSADESVRKAKELGAKEEQARSAKEAAAAVAGGGRTAGSTAPDLSKITDINKLREMVKSMHGVADR